MPDIWVVSSRSCVHYVTATEDYAAKYKKLLEDKCGYVEDTICPKHYYWITKLEMEKVKGKTPFIL
jgi:hypothetical protein